MNEQLIEELKDLRIYLKAIKATMYVDSIDKVIKSLTSIEPEKERLILDAMEAGVDESLDTSVKTTIDEDKLAKAIREAEIMFEWHNKDGNPNRANGQKIILECLQDIQKSNFTSVKSESAEEVKESLEKKARDWEFQNRESEDSDYHSYRAGYNQAMHDFTNNSEEKGNKCAEEYLREAVWKNYPNNQNAWENFLSEKVSFDMNPIYEAINNAKNDNANANNSEAMKKEKVDYEFIEWVLDVNNEIFYVSDTTKDIYGFHKIGYYKVSETFICGTTQELYNIYLTNKENTK